jgi:hypothetical protein
MSISSTQNKLIKTLKNICKDIYSITNTSKEIAAEAASNIGGIKNRDKQYFEVMVEAVISKYCTDIVTILDNDTKIIKNILKQSISIKFDKIKDTLNVKNLYYMRNPRGSQCPPDFVIICNGELPVKIECKSARKLTPVWNCSIPAPDTIYVFNSSSINKTFVFRRHHIISEANAKYITTLCDEVTALCKEFSKKNKLETAPTFDYYPRKMFNQKTKFNPDDAQKMYEETIASIDDLL